MGNRTNSLRSRVEALAKDATLEISLDDYRYDTIRGYAAYMGIELNRRYSTTIKRDTRTCIITRYE